MHSPTSIPDLDSAPTRATDLAQIADVRQTASGTLATPLSADPAVGQTLRGSFGSLYASPDVAQATYQSLSQFAGSAAANDLLANGGARGAERLGPLRPDLPEAQREAVPGALGRALGAFAPEQAGAVSRIVPGAQVLRDDRDVPVVGPAPAQEQGLQPLQWVAGIGIEARGQYAIISGSAVSGVVFDDDGSVGTFSAVGAGPGLGAGGQIGPTAFAVAGIDDIEGIGGLGVQLGGFVGSGVAADAGITFPVGSDGRVAGAGVTLPAGPAAGAGVGIYSELGYTRVERLFELRDLRARGGAAIADLPADSRAVVDRLMSGIGVGSYAEMASYLLSAHRSVAGQLQQATGRR